MIQKIKDWFREFHAEFSHIAFPVYVGTFVFVTLGILLHKKENQKEHRIPLAFSEISRIYKENERDSLLSINLYLASLNDWTGKIFEAYNRSEDVINFSPRRFAAELEYHIDPTYKWTKYNLPSLTKSLDTLGQKVRAEEVPQLNLISGRTLHAQNVLSRVWMYDRDDTYHTTYYTVKGKLHSRRVYDYSDHTWEFNSQAAYASLIALNNIKPLRVRYHKREEFKTASQIGPENEVVMDKWIPINHEGDRHSQAEYDSLAIAWLWGSTYLVSYKHLEAALKAYQSKSDYYNTALMTGTTKKLRTYSQSRPSYMPYDMTLEAQTGLLPLIRDTEELEIALNRVPKEIGPLFQTIKTFIGVTLDGLSDPRSPEELAELVIEDTRRLYGATYSKAFDVQGYSAAKVILTSLLFALLTGGATAFLLNAKKWP